MKTQKQVIIYMLLTVASFVFCYSATAFVNLEMDVTKWEEIQRQNIVVGGVSLSMMSIAICNYFKAMSK